MSKLIRIQKTNITTETDLALAKLHAIYGNAGMVMFYNLGVQALQTRRIPQPIPLPDISHGKSLDIRFRISDDSDFVEYNKHTIISIVLLGAGNPHIVPTNMMAEIPNPVTAVSHPVRKQSTENKKVQPVRKPQDKKPEPVQPEVITTVAVEQPIPQQTLAPLQSQPDIPVIPEPVSESLTAAPDQILEQEPDPESEQEPAPARALTPAELSILASLGVGKL